MNKFLTFLAGAGLGAVAGLLLAPRRGEELREEISARVREGYDTVAERVQEQGGIRGIVEKGVERGKSAVEMGRQRVNESIERGKNRISDSIEAGKSEYYRQRDRDVTGT
jgi:gas vesicle protein